MSKLYIPGRTFLWRLFNKLRFKKVSYKLNYNIQIDVKLSQKFFITWDGLWLFWFIIDWKIIELLTNRFRNSGLRDCHLNIGKNISSKLQAFTKRVLIKKKCESTHNEEKFPVVLVMNNEPLYFLVLQVIIYRNNSWLVNTLNNFQCSDKLWYWSKNQSYLFYWKLNERNLWAFMNLKWINKSLLSIFLFIFCAYWANCI